MKVYTKTGDEGQTSLYSKQRVFKDDVRVEAYGTVDEASTAMGLAKSLIKKDWIVEIIEQLQQELISLNADLATVPPEGQEVSYQITPEHVTRLEGIIDRLEGMRIPQKYFVTSGTSSAGAALDMARTMVRRAERCVVRVKRSSSVPAPVSLYLNRLSDLLFVLARCVEQEELIALATSRVMAVLKGEEEKVVKTKDKSSLLDRAKSMLEAAEYKAMELGVPMVIALVDEGGNLIAQHRRDGALLASISLALDKAYTAVALKCKTEALKEITQPGADLYQIESMVSRPLVTFGGGFPLTQNGKLIGGLGISGGTVAEDVTIGEYAMDYMEAKYGK